jgi:lipopolysaccharide export system protein LptA
MVSSGDISCNGKVQIDLQSAEDARRHPNAAARSDAGARVIHVDTSRIVFNQKTGSAATDQPVVFRLPDGEGRGIGFRYDPEQGQVQLLHDVNLVFHPQSRPGATQQGQTGTGDITIDGSSLIFFRDERRLRMLGHVSARQEDRELSAGELELEMDPGLRPQKLVANGSPALRETLSGGARTVAADQISAIFSEAGWLESAAAEGNVHATSRSTGGEDRLEARQAQLAFANGTNRPQRLTATGSVRVQSVVADGSSRNLETSEIVMDFAKAQQSGAASIEHVKTPAATLDFERQTMVSGQLVPEHVHMASDHLDADFTTGNQLARILGEGGVQVRREIREQPEQIATSRQVVARFAPDGEWSTVDQTGDVRLSQADRTASADRAQFDQASDSVALSGSVVLVDSSTRTVAQSAVLREDQHEFRADGRVTSTDVLAGASRANPGSGPARISADHMVADTSTGHATYSGTARLWQGDSLVEANTIELNRATGALTATGRVHSVFPQARWAPVGSPAATRSPAAKSEYWHVEARRMTYDSQAGRGHLEGEVRAQCDEGTIRADQMDLFFAPAGASNGAALSGSTAKPLGDSTAGLGGKQLVRATADGHVIVDEEDRHGNGTHADYAAEAGKIALSGGPPSVRDSSGNVTTGRELTFYFRDDTIDIDSAEGTRTLTLHRVEK